jgi:glycolate oxidase FAD binding subunit
MVLSPADREGVGEALARLDGQGVTVMPLGGGTATPPLDRPPDVLLLTRGLDRLVDYQPDDMTITVEAGMTLAAVQATLAARGQVLPLDPPLPERATMGGVVAGNRTGPWRAAYRSPRDWVIGLTVIGPDGRAVKGGGRVVKNVAGYDLPRLYTGSRGTLGVIVEVSFKVMPRPPAAGLSLVPLPDAERAESVLARVIDSDLMPTCLELLNSRAARELPGAAAESSPYRLVVGFEGVPAAITWQQETLAGIVSGVTTTSDVPESERPALLAALRAFATRPGCLHAQVGLLSGDVALMAAWCEAEGAARGMEVALAAHAANGVLRLRIVDPSPDPAEAAAFVEAVRDAAVARGGSLAITGGLPEIVGRIGRERLAEPAARLMRGIKEALDPHGTMFAGGLALPVP